MNERFCLRIKCTWLLGFSLLVCWPASVVAQEESKADLVLLDGKVVTVDSHQPQAEAVAVQGETIVAVGTSEEIRAWVGEQTEVIDLQGQLMIPGFIEGHAHFVGLGESKMMLDLKTAKSWDDVVNQVETAVSKTPPGQWIVGRGWHQEKWTQPPSPNVEGYPTGAAMNKVSPNHPVLLVHMSGHLAFANEYAMRLAGIDDETPDPAGGAILRDEAGKAIGIFRETAADLVELAKSREDLKRSAEETLEYQLRAIKLATAECLKKGITSFQDAGSPINTIKLFQQLDEQQELRLRLWVMVRDDNQVMEMLLPAFKRKGFKGNRFTLGGIKRSIDGALGAHGAWLLVPYEDLPGSIGHNTAPIESVKESARIAIENDLQLCVHAIGDQANRVTLDIFEEFLKSIPRRNHAAGGSSTLSICIRMIFLDLLNSE